MDPCTVIADSIDVASYFYLLMWVDVSFKGHVKYPRGHVSSIALIVGGMVAWQHLDVWYWFIHN